MIEEMEHPEHDALWQDATDNKPLDWDRVFDGYRSAVDWPAAAFWPELSSHYPEAKIILTTRDPDRWFKSISNTIFPTLLSEPGPNEPATPAHRHMTYSLIIERIFQKRIHDREFVVDVFRKNTERVLQEIPASRVLHYQPGDGWEPLCEFLEVTVPDEPFPHLNDTAAFLEWTGIDKWAESSTRLMVSPVEYCPDPLTQQSPARLVRDPTKLVVLRFPPARDSLGAPPRRQLIRPGNTEPLSPAHTAVFHKSLHPSKSEDLQARFPREPRAAPRQTVFPPPLPGPWESPSTGRHATTGNAAHRLTGGSRQPRPTGFLGS